MLSRLNSTDPVVAIRVVGLSPADPTTMPLSPVILVAAILLSLARTALPGARADDSPHHRAEFVFPLDDRHNHAPGIVECPDGQLLVSWYRGSGERKADDVVILGARLPAGAREWSEPFTLADNPGFPDCNTCLFLDATKKLWLFWPIILDNEWGSALTNYRTSSDYLGPGAPAWDWQGVIWLKPDDFQDRARTLAKQRLDSMPAEQRQRAEAFFAEIDGALGNTLTQRLGWQPRAKPTQLRGGRIVLPLYSDTYSFSLMALSDDGGRTWRASQPLIGFGNIQPTVLERRDGSLVAYMRENGPLERIRTCESADGGDSWGEVGVLDLPNPGSGLDAVRLSSGHWVMVHNDTTDGRASLAVSLSEDEGATWPHVRHLEKHADGQYHYPAVIEGADGTIHAVYSYFVPGGKSMKHAAFNEAWVRAGDAP
jgi:predicted neuraminidase